MRCRGGRSRRHGGRGAPAEVAFRVHPVRRALGAYSVHAYVPEASDLALGQRPRQVRLDFTADDKAARYPGLLPSAPPAPRLQV
jgi:hypothetical protein